MWLSTAYSIYESYSGTLMAVPHATGAVALNVSTRPGSTAAAIKAAVLGIATPTTSLTGKCMTGGRLNVSGFQFMPRPFEPALRKTEAPAGSAGASVFRAGED